MAPIGPGFTVGLFLRLKIIPLSEVATAGRGGAGGSTLCARPRVEERM
jgi:hypothetical protein